MKKRTDYVLLVRSAAANVMPDHISSHRFRSEEAAVAARAQLDATPNRLVHSWIISDSYDEDSTP